MNDVRLIGPGINREYLMSLGIIFQGTGPYCFACEPGISMEEKAWEAAG